MTLAAIGDIAFMDGNFWLGVFIGILVIGLILGVYTRRGSGISAHPTGEARGRRAPGAAGVPHDGAGSEGDSEAPAGGRAG